jgi:hypothetical protein
MKAKTENENELMVVSEVARINILTLRLFRLLNINQLNGNAERVTDDLRRCTGGDRKAKKRTKVLSCGHAGYE